MTSVENKERIYFGTKFALTVKLRVDLYGECLISFCSESFISGLPSRNGKFKIHKTVIFSLLYGVKTDTPH